MGTQFWWIFDVTAVAVLLVTIYLAGKKGFSKTIIIMLGYILSMAVAVGASSSVAQTVYKNSVKQSNISNIKKALDDTEMTQKMKFYIESLGYSVTLDEETTLEIFYGGGDVPAELYQYVCNINGVKPDTEEAFREKLTVGYSDIICGILEGKLTDYEIEKVAENIKSNPDSISEFFASYNDEDSLKSAEYIEVNYTAGSAADIIKIFCFIIIVFVLMTIVRVIAMKLNKSDAISPLGDIADHAVGGVFGIIEGAAILFMLAALVRALVIMGSDEMMIFNSDAVNKTFLFKHIYNLVLKL